jgi:hypothetical protein
MAELASGFRRFWKRLSSGGDHFLLCRERALRVELDSRVAEPAAEFGYTPDQLTNHVKLRRSIIGSRLHW